MITLERNEQGWLVKCPATGGEQQIVGKKATLLSMVLAATDYQVRDDFHPFDPFTAESLQRGREAFVREWEALQPKDAP